MGEAMPAAPTWREKGPWFDSVVRDRRLRGLPGCVAWRILDRMGTRGSSYPTAPLIARELRCTERAVWDAIRLLARLGYLRIERGGGRGKANRYFLENLNAGSCFPAPKNLNAGSENHERPRSENLNCSSGESLQEESSQEKSPQRSGRRGATSASASEDEIVSEVGRRCIAICGLDPSKLPPAKRRRLFEPVARWLASGADPGLDIYPTVEFVTRRQRQNQPGWETLTLDYFTGPVADALRERGRAVIG